MQHNPKFSLANDLKAKLTGTADTCSEKSQRPGLPAQHAGSAPHPHPSEGAKCCAQL